MQAEENQRRHMAAELHDELGQNLTAIQTHVKLAQSRLQQAGMEDIGTSINSILSHMRRALHRLLDDLRPAVLDEFGLMRALDEGPIRDLMGTAGMTYHTELHGDPRLLEEDIRTAIYRLAQESATNAVKQPRPANFACVCASVNGLAQPSPYWISAITALACPSAFRAVDAACKACAIGYFPGRTLPITARSERRTPAYFVAKQHFSP